MKKQYQSAILLLIAAIIWGLAFVPQCDTGELGPLSFLACRSFLGSLVLIPVAFILEKAPLWDQKTKDTIKYGMLAGCALFLASALQQLGISLSPNAGKAGLITAMYMLLVPLISFLLWKRKTGLHVLFAALISLVGLYFLTVTPGSFSIEKGDTVLLISPLFWAIHVLIIDRFVAKTYPIRLSAVQFFVCGVLSLIFGCIFENPSLSQIPTAWFAIVFCGVFSSGIAFTLQVLGQRHCDPSVASILMSSESLFSVIGGIIFLQERLNTRSLIGCLLVLCGILISQLPTPKKKPAPEL